MLQDTNTKPIYGGFNTATWRKINLHKTDHPGADGYLYKGSGFSFRSEDEFQFFLNSFCGTVFPHGKHYVVWCYRDIIRPLPADEWDAINSPVTQRIVNGRRLDIKTVKDLKNHIVFSYYTNNPLKP